MKCDLHLHSFLSRKFGDSINWVDETHVLRSLYKNGIKAAAITDHDIFSKEFFYNMQRISDEKMKDKAIKFYPSTELTLRRVDKKGTGHCLCILTNWTDEILDEFEKKVTENTNRLGMPSEKAFELFAEYKPLFIPHVSKVDFLTYEDLGPLNDLLIYGEAPAGHSKLRSLEKKLGRELKPIMFSDSHFWDKYKPPVNGEMDIEDLSERK